MQSVIKSLGQLCSKCGGYGKIKTKKFIKSRWQVHQDNAVVGKYTSCIPNLYAHHVAGQEIHDCSKPLDLDVCPDRVDLVGVSVGSGVRVSKLREFYKARLKAQNHYLKVIPVCMVFLKVQGGVRKRVFIIGMDSVVYDPSYDLEMRTRLLSQVPVGGIPDSKRGSKFKSIVNLVGGINRMKTSSSSSKNLSKSTLQVENRPNRGLIKSDSIASGTIIHENPSPNTMNRRFSLYK